MFHHIILFFFTIIFYSSISIKYLYRYDNYTYNQMILNYNKKYELYYQLNALLLHSIKIDVIYNIYLPEILNILYITPSINQYIYILSNVLIIPTKKTFPLMLIKFVYYSILSYYIISENHILSIIFNTINYTIYTFYWVFELNKMRKKIDM
jgi:hypothetical protein